MHSYFVHTNVYSHNCDKTCISDQKVHLEGILISVRSHELTN